MAGGDRTELYPIRAGSTTQELSDAALRLSRSGGGNRVGAREKQTNSCFRIVVAEKRSCVSTIGGE